MESEIGEGICESRETAMAVSLSAISDRCSPFSGMRKRMRNEGLYDVRERDGVFAVYGHI